MDGSQDATKHPVGHGVSVGHLVMYNSAIPGVIARQVLLSMAFPGQEYWSGLPFPSPGHLPSSGMELASPVSPALA